MCIYIIIAFYRFNLIPVHCSNNVTIGCPNGLILETNYFISSFRWSSVAQIFHIRCIDYFLYFLKLFVVLT